MAVFNSFADLAVATGVKIKTPRKKITKCPNCGGALREIEGTNILACDFSKLEEKTREDGTVVQVFSPCGKTMIVS